MQSICHRDLKPDNFLITSSGDVCLGDFGTARSLDGRETALLPEYAGWRGDRRYTAPEMLAVIEDDPSLFYSADMFSLGAILFEMFTKVNLIALVLDLGFQVSFLDHFRHIDPEHRSEMFSQVIGSVASSRTLSNIYEFDNPIPTCIRERLNHLYKGLASLDYRRRTRDFSAVFSELERCETILRNEAKYQKWIEWRRNWYRERLKLK